INVRRAPLAGILLAGGMHTDHLAPIARRKVPVENMFVEEDSPALIGSWRGAPEGLACPPAVEGQIAAPAVPAINQPGHNPAGQGIGMLAPGGGGAGHFLPSSFGPWSICRAHF